MTRDLSSIDEAKEIPASVFALKRFLAFTGAQYYPSGGMGDFIGDFDTIEEAIAAIRSDLSTGHHKGLHDAEPWRFAWAHIWDSQKRDYVWKDGSLIP